MKQMQKLLLMVSLTTISLGSVQAISNTVTNNILQQEQQKTGDNGIINNIITKVKNFINILTKQPIDLSKENINETISNRFALFAALENSGIPTVIPFVNFDAIDPYTNLKVGNNIIDSRANISIPILDFHQVFNFKVTLTSVKSWADALKVELAKIPDSEKTVSTTLVAGTLTNSKANIDKFKLWTNIELNKRPSFINKYFYGSVVVQDAILLNSKDNKLKNGLNSIQLTFKQLWIPESPAVTFTIFANAK